jgi:hypothetical protein
MLLLKGDPVAIVSTPFADAQHSPSRLLAIKEGLELLKNGASRHNHQSPLIHSV